MYSRHDLVWLSAEGWQAACAQVPAEDLDAIEMWRREDWPAIVRRNDAGASADVVSLGVALPPDQDGHKRRIALNVAAAHIARHERALPLSDALTAAPGAWQPGLAALDAGGHGVGLRAYGSLALQAITGQRYLTQSSDVDLLFCPTTSAQLEVGIRLLSSHEVLLPIDGEVVFPSGDAVAWKEWRDAHRNRARVLVKSIGSVRLAEPAELAATLEAA